MMNDLLAASMPRGLSGPDACDRLDWRQRLEMVELCEANLLTFGQAERTHALAFPMKDEEQ